MFAVIEDPQGDEYAVCRVALFGNHDSAFNFAIESVNPDDLEIVEIDDLNDEVFNHFEYQLIG